ncbi:MAG: dihydroneopterin aldolase [Bacteroidia bacterium]|nr:dihydroneopterin aldolase [Bacteroidia bacterium]
MGQIEIEGIHFYAFHGHFETERIVGNEFRVDVSLETNCTPASLSDDLNDALNYQEVYNLIRDEMQIPSHLLEHVAGRILDSLFARFSILQKATVKVSKLNPPMGGQIDKVSVTLSRTSGSLNSSSSL